MKTDILVVGAGFAGSVIAERMAEAGKSVLVIDRRKHIGGNAFDEYDPAGVLVHRYGPHIFHTNASHVVNYLSRFTKWRNYEHRVLSSVEGQLYPIPINRTTINKLYNLSLDEKEVSQFLDSVREHREVIRNSEDVVLTTVGRDLCEKFFRNYTYKQWSLDLADLAPGVAGRIPVRTNDDDRYFTDQFQQMPDGGYTAMFSNMLAHSRVQVLLGTSYEEIRSSVSAEATFYTGRIDEYFDFAQGKLPYRSLRFEHEHLPQQRYQPVGTVNYPNDFSFTRITEFKHLTGQQHHGTSIVREFPDGQGDPYYPVPTDKNMEMYQAYKRLANSQKDVFFVGRLAEYRYYNMDQVVAAALKVSHDYLAGKTSMVSADA